MVLWWLVSRHLVQLMVDEGVEEEEMMLDEVCVLLSDGGKVDMGECLRAENWHFVKPKAMAYFNF